MNDFILNNTYLILLLPFWIFLIIMGGRFFSVYVNKKIIYTLTLLSSFAGILLTAVGLLNIKDSIEQSFNFIKINDYALSFGVHIDKLSLIIAFILFTVSFLVQVFAITYMKNEKKNYRFFAFLNMFNFSMAGLLFSPNLFQMYAFWELVGVMSYLLIGFDYKNNDKSQASRRVFITNRIGDVALLAGIITTSYFMYNYAGNRGFATLGFEDMNAISTLLYAYTSTPEFYIICSLFIIGAAVKSAQFPFYTWLQDAMEAKLPVSALLHSATMVVAGIYLIIRLLPFFTLEKNILNIIGIIGILTALICSVLASIETHPKKVLAYSTSVNLGLMFLALGMLNIKCAVILLAAHAFIKSMLFLSLDIKETYTGYIAFLLGGLCLAGLLFSGIVPKEALFVSVENNVFLSVIYQIISFLGAFYIMRLAIVMIKDKPLVKTVNLREFLPVAGLFLLNILFYFFVKGKIDYKIAEPFWCAIAGWAGVYLFYKKDILTKFDKSPRLLEKLYNCIFVRIYAKTAYISDFIDVKIFGNYKIIKMLAKSGVKLINFVETNVMYKSVSLTADAAKRFSAADSGMQTGNIQSYNAYAFIWITVIICCIITAYMVIITQMS